MKQTIERVTAMALERFGKGELQIDQAGEVFWRRPDGHRIPLGYTIHDARHWLITLSGEWDRSVDRGEEEE